MSLFVKNVLAWCGLMAEEKDELMNEEMKDFLEKISENSELMQGIFLHYGRFYRIYNTEPSKALLTLYDEIFQVHRALLGTLINNEVEDFEKIKEVMINSLNFLTDSVKKIEFEKMKEEFEIKMDEIKKALPLMKKLFKNEEKDKTLYI